jgi:outer membrane lipoprotein-sorting protein
MKSSVLLIFLLTISLSVVAQDAEKAKSILDQVSAKTKKYQTITAEFTFSMENLQENISETHQGKILLKGNKYKVSLMGADSYFDGTSIYTHMIDAEEVNISVPDPGDDETLNPADIFTIYESGFYFHFVGEKEEDGKTVYEIDLLPENRDKPFSRIKLKILKDDLSLYSLKQVGKDGNHFTIQLKTMITNEPMGDALFVFDQATHPNVDVIDMR